MVLVLLITKCLSMSKLRRAIIFPLVRVLFIFINYSNELYILNASICMNSNLLVGSSTWIASWNISSYNQSYPFPVLLNYFCIKTIFNRLVWKCLNLLTVLLMFKIFALMQSFQKKSVIINIFKGEGIYITLNVSVFSDFHRQSFWLTNRNLHFLWNVNLTKVIRPRTRKVSPLGNELLLFTMWGMKLISRFRTQWKCRWMRSPSIYQNAKTHHFRHTELHTSPPVSCLHNAHQDPIDLGPDNQHWYRCRHYYLLAPKRIISPEAKTFPLRVYNILEQSYESYLDFASLSELALK